MVEPLLSALLAASVPLFLGELIEGSGDFIPVASYIIEVSNNLAKQKALLFAPGLPYF